MWVTVSELVNLSSFPNTERGCRKALDKLAKENPNIRRKKAGTKAFEYNSLLLPTEVQNELQAKFAVNVINRKLTDLPVKREALDVQSLSDKQRAIADARMALVLYVAQLEKIKPRYLAVQQVVDMAKAGTLPEHLMDLIRIANARQGDKRVISQRSLMGWVVDYHKSTDMVDRLQRLAPVSLGRQKQDIYSLPWLHDFLSVYQHPNNPTVVACLKSLQNFSKHEIPSLSTVRSVLKKLPVPLLKRGRVTGAEYRAFTPYTVRDWQVLNVNECWVGDGHGFKAKVKHPFNGRPFQPEITAIIDGRTRYIVGWSVHMSENHLAVCDALRHGISQCGLPNIYYSDNGAGEKNKQLDAPLTGILPRLGIHHEVGRPGNPQGRGIIERFWRTAIIPLARQYDSFVGQSLDRDTRRLRHRELDSAVNAIAKNNVLTLRQQKAMQKLPHFEDFLQDLTTTIAEYNQKPHSELPKNKATGEHYSPSEYRELLLNTTEHSTEFLSDFELSLLFRPEEVRTVQRGMVSLFNNSYFHTALAEYHSQSVRVCYDLHDANSVIVKTMDGSWICNALWNGNKVDAFAKSVREQAQEKRLKAQIQRKEKEIEHKKSFVNPVIELKPSEGANLLHSLRTKQVKNGQKKKIAIFKADLKRQSAVGE